MDDRVVFPRVLRILPTFDEWLAQYKWNILERAVKPKSKKKNAWSLTSMEIGHFCGHSPHPLIQEGQLSVTGKVCA